MKDLARELGVDASTVSLALRGDPRVASATRERVLRLAERRGYVRDPGLSALAERRWRAGERSGGVNWGYLRFARSDRSVEESPIFQACQTAAERRGFPLIPLAVTPKATAQQINRRLRDLGIRGVLVDPAESLERSRGWSWDQLRWDWAAWVQAADGPEALPVHGVATNAFRSTVQALQRLAGLGYRRILFVRGAGENRVARRQRAAFLWVQAETPGNVWLELDAGGSQHLQAMLRRLKPDVVLAAYRQLGFSLRLSEAGLSWASLGLVNESGDGIAGMCWEVGNRAEAAVDLLEQQYRKGAFGKPEQRYTIMLDSTWVGGPTLQR